MFGECIIDIAHEVVDFKFKEIQMCRLDLMDLLYQKPNGDILNSNTIFCKEKLTNKRCVQYDMSRWAFCLCSRL